MGTWVLLPLGPKFYHLEERRYPPEVLGTQRFHGGLLTALQFQNGDIVVRTEAQVSSEGRGDHRVSGAISNMMRLR